MRVLFGTTTPFTENQKVVYNLYCNYKPEFCAMLIDDIVKVTAVANDDKNYCDCMKKCGAEIIDRNDSMLGKISNEIINKCEPIDCDILNKMSPFEAEIFNQLQRSGYGFRNHFDMMDKYLNILRYWNDFLDNRKIDTLIAFNILHEGFDYIIYCLCKIKGVKILMANMSPVLQHFYFLHDIKTPGINFEDKLQDTLKMYNGKSADNIELSKDFQDIIDKYYGDKDTTPFYMKRAKKIYIKTIVKYASLFCKKLFSGNFVSSYRNKQQNELIPAKEYKIIKKYYDNKMESNLDLTQKYIYFPMHFQPECTSNPMGGRYDNQLLIVQMISAYLPENYFLYVKEHPMQKLSLYRRPNIFEKMASLPNVKLIDTKFSSMTLAKNAIATATITGTAGWEAFFNRKPVLMFGSFIYQYASGVFTIKTKENCKESIKLICDGVNIDLFDQKCFLKAMEAVCYKGYVDPVYAQTCNFSQEENIDLVTAAYIAEIDKMLGDK